MKRFLWIFSVVFAIFFLAACSNTEVAIDDSDVILFFSETCPHCKNVEEYIEKNKIKEKVEFSEKEVGLTGEKKSNTNLMMQKQKDCKVDEQSVGSIPFLWTKDGKCLMGDEDIIKFFKEKAGI